MATSWPLPDAHAREGSLAGSGAQSAKISRSIALDLTGPAPSSTQPRPGLLPRAGGPCCGHLGDAPVWGPQLIMDTLLSLEHEREQVSGTFHEALVEPNEDISGLRRCMRPPPPPPKHRAAPLDGRPDRWLLVESVPNLPGLPQPWGSPLCHLPHVLPLPVPKPHPKSYIPDVFISKTAQPH